MRVWIGPPGSGKTSRVLREAAGRDDSRLVVPTATMAEHLRHELARQGFVLRSSAVQTLREFTAPLIRTEVVSRARLELRLAEILDSQCPREFREVAAFEGFRRALLSVIEELANAGCDSLRLEALANLGVWRGRHTQAIRRVAEAFTEPLRPARLLEAAANIRSGGLPGIARVYFDGFFSFSLSEREVIRACNGCAAVTVTLPAWTGANASLAAFEEMGARVEHLSLVRAVPETILVAPPSRELEAEEIARRIREEAADGRPWREMGVIVRSAGVYAPLLRTTFERFGIPAHFYFAEPLAAHPVTLALLRAASALAGEALPAQWQARLGGLRDLVAPPEPDAVPSREAAARYARRALAWKGWLAALEETAEALSPEKPISRELFVNALTVVLEASELRPPPSPRDSVAVMDVVESRQWELPVVFVAGLLEGEFPAAPRAEPLLPDELRIRLRENGAPLDTAADRQRTEQFLLEVAFSRATEKQVLSWPAADAAGEPALPSFLLRARFPQAPAVSRACRPAARGALRELQPSRVADPALRKKPKAVSVSGLESFLQCPFQYFGGRMLGLRAAREAFDRRSIGEFVHGFLRKWHETGQPFEPMFEREWKRFLRENKIEAGYKVEVERLALLRGLRGYCQDPRVRASWKLEFERELELDLDGVTVRMRADRIDTGPDGECALVDFKLSSAQSVKDRVQATEEGLSLQGGLYALAVDKPVSFQFVSLKESADWKGWTSAEELSAVMETSRAAAVAAIARIAGAVIAPSPADTKKCEWCDFRDACRVRAAAELAAGAEGL